MTLPRLDSTTVDAYLTRLGRPSVSLDLAGLSRLQQAHLRELPFHNLALLANDGRPPGLPRIEAAVEASIAGLGGTCHQLTPPFATLLSALGFNVWLAAASVNEPGDHFVGVVQLPEGRFIVDVGNGHPYLHPFPLDDGPLEFTAYGWPFRFQRDEREKYRLLRTLPDGQVKTVYRLSPEPRPYAAFETIIHAHHVQPGFGPFLAALRAVRMTEWALVTLRNTLYQRFAGGLTSTRSVATWDALAQLLRNTFTLPTKLIEQALQVLQYRVPNLFGKPRRSRPDLRFILSLAVTERTEGVNDLLRSLDAMLRQSHRSKDTLGVLLLDNSRTRKGSGDLDGVLKQARQSGLRVSHLDVRDTLWRLAPFQHSGLLPDSLSVPLPIGASRTLQTALLHEHLRNGSLGLPHPNDGGSPVVVWMLDDDLAFQRLSESPEGLQIGPGDDLLARAESLWSEHPDVSVVLGTFTGEPPIPGYATFQVQLHDLVGNLGAMAGGLPDAPWGPGGSPRDLSDYYYDHARGSTVHLQAVFPWTPPEPPPWTIRRAFISLCLAFAQVPHGRQVTRQLTYRPTGVLSPSRNRGGNALFLDLDALVAAPYPVLCREDGVVTRRADTLWAHLAPRDSLVRLVQADFDLLHGRRIGDGSSPLAMNQPSPAALRKFVEGQERGVVLARLLERGHPVQTSEAEHEVSSRRDMLARSREGVRMEVKEARYLLKCPNAWWWREPESAASAQACLATLEQVETLTDALHALEDPLLAEHLAAFARHVVGSLPGWRSKWA